MASSTLRTWYSVFVQHGGEVYARETHPLDTIQTISTALHKGYFEYVDSVIQHVQTGKSVVSTDVSAAVATLVDKLWIAGGCGYSHHFEVFLKANGVTIGNSHFQAGVNSIGLEAQL